MAEQRFSGVFREALWSAHEEKCIYCGKEIAFLSLVVDHVIPESLLKNPTELAEVRSQLNLPDGFNIRGYENLAPSCAPCNTQKSDLPLGLGVLIVLAKVESRIPAVQAFIDKKRQERNLDNTLRHILRSVEAGKFTHEQLLQGLKVLQMFPDGLHGASPNAPPASPERAQFGIYIPDQQRLFFTPRAERVLERLGLHAGKINELIYRAVETGSIRAYRLKGSMSSYVLRLERDRRLIFEAEGDNIRILDIVEHK